MRLESYPQRSRAYGGLLLVTASDYRLAGVTGSRPGVSACLPQVASGGSWFVSDLPAFQHVPV
jgi:hypothetical protein